MGGVDAKQTVETRTVTLTLEDERIVRVCVKPGVEITLEDAKESREATARLVGEGRFRVLVDARQARGVSREARQFQMDPEIRKDTVAQAIIVGSPASRVIANFFLGRNRAPYPVKLFTDMDKAVAWLRGFDVSDS